MVAIALVARASAPAALVLGAAMLGLQFCIGAVNDLFDEALDAQSKPAKPLPVGLVSRKEATAVAFLAAGIAFGALIAFRADAFVLLMAAWMLGAGLVYDAWLKPTAFGWICFAAAFPVLPLFAWYGSTGALPPRWEILLPVAALAGPALHLANGLVDFETDRAAGTRTLAVRLGRRPALIAMTALMAVIHGLGWITLPTDAGLAVVAVSVVATALAAAGLGLSTRLQREARDLGWSLQAASIAALGFGWLLAAAP